MFEVLCVLVVLITVPVTFVTASAKSIKNGTFQQEREKQGALFYIGVVPVVTLAAVAVVFLFLDETVYAIIAFFIMTFWGLLTACIAEAKKR